MKIVIAPDSFKGSNSSIMVAGYIERGVRKVFPSAVIEKIAVADGGEGTVEAVLEDTGGSVVGVSAAGPLGDRVEAEYGLLDNSTAVMEMASASGLTLVPEDKRDPERSSTYGTGELIKDALEKGCKKIIIGIGGSGTNDGGSGMAEALGVVFLDEDGEKFSPSGGDLGRLARIDISGKDKRLADTEIIIACDVSNPLCGKEGASFVYGPQKGADEDAVKRLDNNLGHLAEVVKRDLGLDLADIPGAGAAGGLGYGLIAFAGARAESGIRTILDAVNFDQHLAGADLVISGEGRIDGQSIYGKVPVGIAERAAEHNIPVLVIVGDIGKGASEVYKYGIDGIMSSVNRAMPLSEAMKNSSSLLEDAAERVMRIIRIGMKISS